MAKARHRPTPRLDVIVHLAPELLAGVTDLLQAILKDTQQILSLSRAIHAQGVKLMAVSTETKAVLARIEQATSDLGVRVAAIQSQIGTGMTDADVAAVNSELGDIASKLDGMAKNPEQPLPPDA